MNLDAIQERLAHIYADEDAAEVTSLTQLTDGWENEVFAFTLQTANAERDLILRIYPGNDAVEKAAREFRAMQKLYMRGFPVPEVLRLATEDSPFGHPYVIMEKINGRSLGDVFGESRPAEQQRLLTAFCQHFVNLHALDKRFFAEERIEGDVWIARRFAHMQTGIALHKKPDFLPLLEWLENRRANIGPLHLCMTHGDYHPHNVLVTSDGQMYVIDWCNAAIADYRYDLAWTLLLIHTYSGRAPRDSILNEYERLRSSSVPHIDYFEVAAAFRRLFGIAVSLSGGAEQAGMRPGAEALMTQNLTHLKNVHNLVVNMTGIEIPEISRLICRYG